MDTVEQMIESFKERYPMDINLYSKPSVDTVMEEYTRLKNSCNHSAITEAHLSAYEKYIIENSIESQTFTYGIECPFFTEQEVSELKDYYAKSGTESYKDYFGENMSVQLSDSHKSRSGKTWAQRIGELQNRAQHTQSGPELDQIKQNLVDLGWNPEIEYNADSQLNAAKRYMAMNDKTDNTEVMFAQPLINPSDYQTNISESTEIDILISNPSVNYGDEYTSSANRLSGYTGANDIEYMKYDLARLFYIQYVLGRKMYHNDFLDNKETNMKIRAKALSDFSKYLGIITTLDPNFSFSDYYKTTQFYRKTAIPAEV
jgi:hypothetical protein